MGDPEGPPRWLVTVRGLPRCRPVQARVRKTVHGGASVSVWPPKAVAPMRDGTTAF